MLLLAGTLAGVAWSADKVIHTQKTKDVVITLTSESGQWKPGKNSFVLEFTSAKDKQAGRRRQGQPQHEHGDDGHGADDRRGHALARQDAGALSRLRSTSRTRGTRQVTVTWDGPAGKGSTKFSVPVR